MRLARPRLARALWVPVLVLLAATVIHAQQEEAQFFLSKSILGFFNDGCAVTLPDLVQICERGPRAGAPCTPLGPDVVPESPKFSFDCCVSPDDPDCETLNPDNFCSDPTPERSCANSGALGRLCVTNEGCDTFVCTAGDPDLLGEECTFDFECLLDPEDPNSPGTCASARDGRCGAAQVGASESDLGRVRKVDTDTALLAVVSEIVAFAQPSNKRDDRFKPRLDFRLVDLSELRFVDAQFCQLAERFGPLPPTDSMTGGTGGDGGGNGNGDGNGNGNGNGDPNS